MRSRRGHRILCGKEGDDKGSGAGKQTKHGKPGKAESASKLAKLRQDAVNFRKEWLWHYMLQRLIKCAPACWGSQDSYSNLSGSSELVQTWDCRVYLDCPDSALGAAQAIAPVRARAVCGRSPGVKGTVAILAGHLLRLDPFGGLRWDAGDLAVAAAYAAPVLLAGAPFLPVAIRVGTPPIAAQFLSRN